jgi:ABC-type transport system substrate-binding protein
LQENVLLNPVTKEKKMSKQTLYALVGTFLLALSLTGCQPAAPEKIIETVIVEKEGEKIVETVIVEGEEPAAEEGAVSECCDVYRIAIFEEPVSLNYWNYLGPGSSVWTQYVIDEVAPTLFDLSDQRFQFIPELAKAIPEPVDNGDGTWSMIVEMVEGATWSDGEAIAAEDVVFTHNACKDLKLTQNWPNNCTPSGADVLAEAEGEYTVKYTFLDQAPSLGIWQAGIALAPILPEHFWADAVAEAYAFVEGVEEPEVERPEDCEAEDADQEACDAWAAYDEAFTNARTTLYEADAAGQPSAGGYITDKWEAGAFVQRTANEGYYFKGAEIIEYEDGTWVLVMPDGTQYQLYGDAEGEETLRFTKGPYSPNIIFSIYGSQDAAFLALANGEVDYVINPLGLSRGLREQAERGEDVTTYTNASYSMYYIAFNMNKFPMSNYEFRQAIDIVLDKEFVAESVLAGVVFPMYSTMPPGNSFWYNPDVPRPYAGLTRQERVDMAVQVLKDAGWSWTAEPYWDEDLEDVTPGEGILGPNGQTVPELTILGPGPAYDPIRATFNQWISEWARELGFPVQSELTGFNTILGPVFVDADYDMYILGWSLGNVAFPDYYFDFWHSSQCTADTGNYNTPCFKNEAYDALVEEFMSTADLNRAQELVYEMQVLLADQRPYITLFYNQVYDLALSRVVFPYTEVLGGIEDQNGLQIDAKVQLTK